MLFPKCFGSLSVIMLLALIGSPLLAQTNSLQRNMLTNNPAQPRFAVTDLVWPANPGDANVCLWADDKLAAVSIGVDDNIQPDHAWWVSMGEKYGFKFTWWIITSLPDSEGTPGFNSFFGTWADFRALYAAGHELGSHSVRHLCVDTTDAFWDDEMRISKAEIEAAVPGCRVKSYAGPCGKTPSAETTAKHYISNRGVTGGTNHANQIRYNQTVVLNDVSAACLLTPGNNSWPCFYRGWQVIFYHYLQGKNDSIENNVLKPIYDHRDNIWVGRYGDVAAYGQSRDTHVLTVTTVTGAMLAFTLADSMNDTLFDYPLTVKVRVDNSWDSCLATQNGRSIATSLVTYAGNKYALVQAVPDRGEVQLADAATVAIKPVRATRPDTYPAGKKVTVFTLDGQRVSSGVTGAPGFILNDMTGNTPTGIYLIRMEGKTGLEKRLIVR